MLTKIKPRRQAAKPAQLAKAAKAAKPAESYLSTGQAAARLAICVQGVRQLIAHGRIKAIKPSRDWIISATDLERYIAVRRKPGRPAKNRLPKR